MKSTRMQPRIAALFCVLAAALVGALTFATAQAQQYPNPTTVSVK